MWALLRNVSGGVWKLSSTKPGSDGNATAVATPEKAPRVTNQSASTAKTQPAIDFARMSKHELEDQICQDFDGADPAVVMRLGHIILESGFGNNNGNGYKDPTTAAANESPNTAASSKKNSRYIFIGTALMNWASIHGFEMPVSMSRVLAFALTETWLSRGLSNEVLHSVICMVILFIVVVSISLHLLVLINALFFIAICRSIVWSERNLCTKQCCMTRIAQKIAVFGSSIRRLCFT
jgi:hypothetical protein